MHKLGNRCVNRSLKNPSEGIDQWRLTIADDCLGQPRPTTTPALFAEGHLPIARLHRATIPTLVLQQPAKVEPLAFRHTVPSDLIAFEVSRRRLDIVERKPVTSVHAFYPLKELSCFLM